MKKRSSRADNDVYFATLPSEKLAPKLMDKIEDYYAFLSASGRLDLYRKSYANTYKAMRTGGATFQTGEQGELTQLNVNHYANILKNLVTMTTAQRPNFECRATNTDEKSQAQTILGTNLMDYYLREKKLERYFKAGVVSAVQLGEGFVMTTWDSNIGQDYGVNPDTGAKIYEGDVAYTVGGPLDVIRDFLKPDAMSHDWMMFRKYVNKWELAQQFPEHYQKIIDLSDDHYDWEALAYLYTPLYEKDDIPVYYFFHKKTPVVNQGRFCMMLDTDLVLLDGPLPYREIPIYRIAAQEMSGTPFGYTVGFDLLAIQEAFDANVTTKLSNQTTFGVQNVWSPPGNAVNLMSIAGGMNLVECVTKPEPLNLTQTPKEIYEFGGELISYMELLSAINSAVRGDPDSNLKSGTAIALVQSMAIQFNSDLQQSYAELLEDVGTSTLKMLRDFAKVPRVAAIVGKSNRRYMQNFTGDDLDQVDRVTVDMGNYVTRTTAGKMNLADNLLQNGLIKDPNQYIMVYTTGKLEPLIENQQATMMLIRGENEDLSEGKPVQAIITDRHDIHIPEHMAVLSSPESRTNLAVTAATLAHVQQHITQWSTMPPALAMFMGMPPPPPGSAPLLPNGQGVVPQPAPNITQELSTQNPATQKASGVQPPQPPKAPPGTNPQTAQQLQNALPQ